MDMLPELTEIELIAAMDIDGRTIAYTLIDEDYGLLARMDRDIRASIERKNENGKNGRKTMGSSNQNAD